MNKPVIYSFLSALVLALSCGAELNAKDAPNIILLLSDDHGWSQVSYPADPRIPTSKSDYLETPNLERLAKAGMQFSSGYAAAPWCTPSRRSIQCGTSTVRSEKLKAWGLPAENMTIPKALKMANPAYQCAHFGKWHIESSPKDCGYIASDGETSNHEGGLKEVRGKQIGTKAVYVDNDDPKLSRSLTDRGIAFMKKQIKDKKPFYLQVSYYAVHLAIVSKEATRNKYVKKGVADRAYSYGFAAMLEDMDTQIGRILDSVDELGIKDNTYIIFTADNGGRNVVPGQGKGDKHVNFPLSGGKQALWEGGVRVPLSILGPGIKPGSICHQPVVGYDFLPTFYAMAGGQKPDSFTAPVDGVNILPLLLDPNHTLKRNAGAIFWHRVKKRWSTMRQGDYKIHLYYTKAGKVERNELYQVADNPQEEGHIITDQPERSDAMASRLLEYINKVRKGPLVR